MDNDLDKAIVTDRIFADNPNADPDVWSHPSQMSQDKWGQGTGPCRQSGLGFELRRACCRERGPGRHNRPLRWHGLLH